MATRRYNGHKHHSRRHQSSEQTNRRRLSKQEEIDLTVDGTDSDKCSDYMNEPTLGPTIHVNSVEDKSGQKIMAEKEMNESKEEIDLNDNCNQTICKSSSELNKSFDKLNLKEINGLIPEDNREKKRGKHLTRAEAVRDTSASPPPTEVSDNEEKSSHTLSVDYTNPQSQTGYSSNSSNQNKLKAQGSTGSLDRSSPCLSRDSSTENYSDLNGTDVQQFLMETLQKNKKDRVFLLKIEQDLNGLVKDTQKSTHKFSAMTSYNRMLVHRVAAFFGFEHNVDVLGTSVVVNKCKNTRIPDLKFKDCIKEDLLHEPKKSILKRDSASLEDGSSSSVSFDGKEKSPDRQTGNLGDSSRSKSFEEREERYEKARARIFNQDSSSSTEGMDGQPTPEHNNCNTIPRDSSPRSSQSNEDIAAKTNNSTEVRTWSSTDSDSSGLLRNDSKSMATNVKSLKVGNSLDSESTTKPTPLSSSSSCGRMSLLTPNSSLNTNNGCPQPKTRPSVTKASSFGGISRNVENGSNSTQIHLSKSGSFNASQNSTHGQIVANTTNSNRSNTPKNNIRQSGNQEGLHKSVASNTTSHQSDQRYVTSQQTSVHSSTASHHNRHHNWHQNSHQNSHPRNNSNRDNTPFGCSVQWPQNYPHFIFQPQNDSNLNQLKDNQYLQSGHQLYLSSLQTYGGNASNETPQHLTQPPIRLIYPNQPQMRPNVNPMMNNSVPHQNVSNQMSSVPFPLQSSASSLNFSGNQSNIQNNPMISGSLSHSYGAPLQMPSNVGNIGTVWIIGNGVNPHQSTSPLMSCPPPSNTPPNASIGSNIAPFVGMSYQQYRPALNSNPSLNPNLSINAAQNRGTAPLLKSQPLLATQANNQRILTSNGNHYIQQQVPDVMDMNNMMGANNFMNRAPVIPQMSHMRRMPANSNQGLDVRLVGPQASAPFLLPTPQRPYFPVSNSMTVNHRSFYANNANNVNQRSKHSFSKNKSQNNRYSNANRNILVPNTHSNCSNT